MPTTRAEPSQSTSQTLLVRRMASISSSLVSSSNRAPGAARSQALSWSCRPSCSGLDEAFQPIMHGSWRKCQKTDPKGSDAV